MTFGRVSIWLEAEAGGPLRVGGGGLEAETGGPLRVGGGGLGAGAGGEVSGGGLAAKFKSGPGGTPEVSLLEVSGFIAPQPFKI